MRRFFVRLSHALFASLATASIAHAGISIANCFARNSYADRAHDGASCTALFVATVAAALWLVAVTRAFSGQFDFVTTLARDVRCGNVVPSALRTAGGGAVVLACIESFEQFAAFGRVGTFADAFGGNVVLGAFAMLVAAFTLVTLARDLAAWLLAITGDGAAAWRSWIAATVAGTDGRAHDDAMRSLRVRDRSRVRYAMFVRSMGGLRAPPCYARKGTA